MPPPALLILVNLMKRPRSKYSPGMKYICGPIHIYINCLCCALEIHGTTRSCEGQSDGRRIEPAILGDSIFLPLTNQRCL